MNSVFHLKEKFEKSWTKKMDVEDKILMTGYLLMRKRGNHQQQKQWSKNIFVVLLRVDVPLFGLFINDPFSAVLSSSNVYQILMFIHFRWVDVKSFSGLSLVSIILWAHYENNIWAFWYYFLRLFETFPPINKIMFTLIRIYARIS